MNGNMWLASFPKSGNTWCRAFLSNYLFGGEAPVSINDMDKYCAGDADIRYYEPFVDGDISTLSPEKVYAARPQAHRMMADSSAASTLVKIHNRKADFGGVATITPELTAGVVYIIRNPLDVAVSFANHYDQSIDTAIQALASHDLSAPPTSDLIYQDLGSWSDHVNSWTNAKGVYMLFMFYEAMVQNPGKTFEQLISFLRVPLDRAKLQRSMDFCSFKSLSEQEQQSGFAESPPTAHSNFFRSGKVGGWRDHLNRDQVDFIVRNHGATMRKFRYLDDKGRLRV